MQLVVRRATMEDAEAIAALNAEVQGLHQQALPDIFQEPDVRVFAGDGVPQLLAPDDDFTLLADSDGVTLGYLHGEIFRRETSLYHRPHVMIYVHQLCVAGTARRQGVGTALLDGARDYGRSLGISRLALDVWQFNEAAQAFFRAYGLTDFNRRMWMPISG